MMALMLSALLFAMILLSALLYHLIVEDKTEARLDELLIQAAEIAFLASQRSASARGLEEYLYLKVLEVQSEFDAGIIVMDVYGRNIMQGVEHGEVAGLPYEETLEYLRQVGESGQPIRVRSRSADGIGDVFTVAFPWTENGIKMGVVFIHTNAQTIRASYSGILSHVAIAMVASAIVLSALLFIVVRQLTRPLRKMAAAASKIAKGEFDVSLPQQTGLREVAVLSDAMAEMTRDLKNLEDMRRSFVSDVSHELRSPLTSMTGFLQGMRDGVIPEDERQRYIGIVLDETRRLTRLVASLLDLSRIESGNLTLNEDRFDVSELIRKALIRYEERINENGMDVNLLLGDEPAFVLADMERIDQVVSNLIDNAIKYGKPNGTLTIEVETNGAKTLVAVEDDGLGIPKDELALVFHRFHTVDKARTSGKGTGLGLAIVKKILDLHRQTITVESEIGKGTRFAFTLKRAEIKPS
jgi:signal transduction histidine kinase